MKQRGRKPASLSLIRTKPRLVSSSPVENSPPPPADLGAPECEIWRDIVADWRGPRLSYAVLADALRVHQTPREARATVAEEGMTVVGRDKQVRAHPLLAIERSAIASYQRQLKVLGIKF